MPQKCLQHPRKISPYYHFHIVEGEEGSACSTKGWSDLVLGLDRRTHILSPYPPPQPEEMQDSNERRWGSMLSLLIWITSPEEQGVFFLERCGNH